MSGRSAARGDSRSGGVFFFRDSDGDRRTSCAFLIFFAALCLGPALIAGPALAEPPTLGPTARWTSPPPFPCFPPEDLSNCADMPLSPGGKAVYSVMEACWPSVPPSGLTALKYAVIVPFLFAGPVGMQTAVKTLGKDAAKCVLKGVVDAAVETTQRKEMLKAAIDTLSEAEGYYGIGKSIQNLRLDPTDAESAAKKAEAASKIWVQGTHRAIGGYKLTTAIRDLRENWYGPGEKVANFLSDYEKMMKDCDFDPVPATLDKARESAEAYCQVAGGLYRAHEKELRCEEEEAMRINDLARLRSRAFAEEKAGIAQEKTDLTTEIGNFFTRIGDERLIYETRSKYFENTKKEHDAAVKSAKEGLAGGNLKTACSHIDKVKKVEESEWAFSKGCGKKMGRDADGLETELNREAEKLEARIAALVKQANQGLKACQLTEARKQLDEAEQLTEAVWSLTGAGCMNSLSQKTRDELAKAKKTFDEIREKARNATELLEQALARAQDPCFYDQVKLDGKDFDSIRELAKEGCIDATEIDGQLAKIRQALTATLQSVQETRKKLEDHLKKAYDAVDPKPPRCDRVKAMEELAAAEELFGKVACEGLPMPVSEPIRYYSRLARKSIDLARKTIEQRIKRMDEAKEEYRDALSRVAGRTDDPCVFKTALNPRDVTTLNRLAREFCAEKHWGDTHAGIQQEVQEMNSRITRDLQNLDSAVALVNAEKDCGKAQAILERQKAQTAYIMRCAEYRSRIVQTIGRMSAIIQQKKAKADGEIRDALSKAQRSLTTCDRLDQASASLKATMTNNPRSCLTTDLYARADATARQIDSKWAELWNAQNRIKALLASAETSLRNCDFGAVRQSLNAARRTMPVDACKSKYQFPALSTNISALYRNTSFFEDHSKFTRQRLTGWLAAMEGYLRTRGKTAAEEQNRVKHYNDHMADVQAIIASARQAGDEACITDLIARAEKLPKSIMPEYAGATGLPGLGGGGTTDPAELRPPEKKPPEKGAPGPAAPPAPPVDRPPGMPPTGTTGPVQPKPLPPVKREEDAWVVWYAPKIGWAPVFITTKKTFEQQEASCRYPGGGIDCKIILEKIFLLGPYPDHVTAKKAICSLMSNFGTLRGVYEGLRVAEFRGMRHNIDTIGGCGTIPPPPEIKPGGQGVDSKALRDEYFKKCTAMREPYVKRNCTPAPGYSGCALDPQGCANYIIVNALPDGKSQGRVGCGRGVVDSYISCLRDCNERLVARKLNVFSIGPCGMACRDKADTATKACNAGER